MIKVNLFTKLVDFLRVITVENISCRSEHLPEVVDMNSRLFTQFLLAETQWSLKFESQLPEMRISVNPSL